MRAMLVAAALVVSSSEMSRAADPNQFPTYPALGQYSNFFASVCGKKMVDTSGVAIPKIGCFATKSGTSITGNIEGRSVKIDVDTNGSETFFVDGSELHRGRGEVTNDEFVKNSTSGFAFCRKNDSKDCPTIIDTLRTVPGEFTVFSVSREFAPHAYVTNEENLEFEQSRRRTP